MSNYAHVENAIITHCGVEVERGFILTVNLAVEMGCGSQGFGGYALGGLLNTTAAVNHHADQKNLMAEWIGGVLSVAGADSLNGCVGKVIRIGKSDKYGKIEGIGHAIKDVWFDPSKNPLFGAKP